MKRIFLKSKISINKDSKRGYTDEIIGELSINEVVDIDTSVTFLILNITSFQSITVDAIIPICRI